ncbi:FMN-dependent NADH-azoreductase [Haloplasma contractile]|uniref:FMN dependent NADH:quinone oxidoreductase n=1 Tax=Haloplasma contractile SSD-17B TaxID=1033810 RepID=U2E8I4_9MOLU|nr:NAD(P)H-dependent oxidoreductase [Haloplasma contractile]ERJ11478.1 FMN-dependent NADH-azoreductase 2 protein [Haloplasma contractile SSD-17B]
MTKVLYIKANPKPDTESNTFKLANEFIDEYKRLNKEDEVKVLDLYKENVTFLDGEQLEKMFGGQDNIMIEYAKQFKEFDKYVFAAPMWNLSIPAILKAYFDYITYVGVTFNYTEQGPVGLLENKKAMHVVTRGGNYSEGPAASFELGDKYVRTILTFMGVKDISTLKLENTNVLMGDELKQAINKAKEDAKKMAKEF